MIWGKIAVVALNILTLGIKARRDAARAEAKRVQDELIALRIKLARLTEEVRSGK